MNFYNRILFTLIGTLALCLMLSIAVTWHIVSVRAAIDAGIAGSK